MTERVLLPPIRALDREGRAPTDDWSRLPAPADRIVSSRNRVGRLRTSMTPPIVAFVASRSFLGMKTSYRKFDAFNRVRLSRRRG